MSGQSNPPKPTVPSPNPLSPNRTSCTVPAFSQFANAAASGYQPPSQMPATAYSSNSGSNNFGTSQQAKSSKTMSDFAASAYETATNDSKALQLPTTNSTKPLQPPVAQPIDLATFKDLKFVTLDGLQTEPRDIYDDVSGTFQWEVCGDQADRCLSYIRDKCGNKRVFLICSGGLGRNFVPQIHALPQIYAIYIYCSDVKLHQEWANNHSKIRVVCNDDDLHLIPQLAVDIAQTNIDWGDALLKKNDSAGAKLKFQAALDKLTKYAKKPDPAMLDQVQNKLKQCN